MEGEIKILGGVGRIRKGSYNQAVLSAAQRLALNGHEVMTPSAAEKFDREHSLTDKFTEAR